MAAETIRRVFSYSRHASPATMEKSTLTRWPCARCSSSGAPGSSDAGNGNTSAIAEPSRSGGRVLARSMRVPSGSTSSTDPAIWPSTTSSALGGSARGVMRTQLPWSRYGSICCTRVPSDSHSGGASPGAGTGGKADAGRSAATSVAFNARTARYAARRMPPSVVAIPRCKLARSEQSQIERQDARCDRGGPCSSPDCLVR